MKIEIDIAPAEVRQLFGLPDTTAAQKIIEDRLTQFVTEQNDGDDARQDDDRNVRRRPAVVRSLPRAL